MRPKLEKHLHEFHPYTELFDVVVVLPGRPCKCIHEYLSKTNDIAPIDMSSPEGAAVAMSTLAPMMLDRPRCLNNGYDATWFTRVWTRQELLYSQEIRIVWTGKNQSPCVFFDASHPRDTKNIEDLTPLAAGLMESLKKQGYSGETALLEMFQRANRLDRTGIHDLQYYTQNQTRKVYRDEQLLARFMKGEKLSSALPYSQDKETLSDIALNQADSMKIFLGGLGRLSRTSPRVATKPHDYVVSVWIDCPDYAIPTDYKDKGIPLLLKNALDQLENHHGKTIVTLVPRGLFDTQPGSGLWAVTESLRQVDLNSATSLYRSIPMADAALIPLSREGAIPICRTNARNPSLAAMIILYETPSSQRNISSVFRTLAQAVPTWSHTTVTNVGTSISAESNKIRNNDAMVEWQQLRIIALASIWAVLLEPHKGLQGTEKTVMGTRQAGEILMGNFYSIWMPHHLELAYTLVAAALGLDEVACRREGLEIVVAETADPDQVVRIGFRRKDMTPERTKSIAKVGGLLTVRIAPDYADEGMTLWENLDGSVLYEVAKTEQQLDGKPTYQVFAVWVPTSRTSSSHIGAVVHTETRDEDNSASVDGFIV